MEGCLEFAAGTTLPLPAPQTETPNVVEAVATGDFDGDGKQDVAVLAEYARDVIAPGYGFETDVPFMTALLVYYGHATTPGTYTVTVTGTSGATTRSTGQYGLSHKVRGGSLLYCHFL
ncbi:hypothetical protein GCM10011507_18670 [Edaphobacter acidisoli]|uniref:Dockerin domain-containing protein n=1 Tax=Edaphobacter acidisoli TaxID=2040573 RepID=A0A916RRW0_9BACT|nr:FG-GAP and VCBS repeat-containing protein [Edaphobacter acidisoli]GGA67416.1 hypothetical protein GCM10011507_18670 [Edaphobacter acidisoli]